MFGTIDYKIDMTVRSFVLAVAGLLLGTIVVSGSPVGDCPPVDPLDHTDHLPDDKNCSLFYKCDHASPVLFACPDGLHFNRLLEVCDWPDAAGCTGNTGSTSSAAPTSSPNPGSTSTSSSTDNPASDAPITSTPATECPAIGTCPQYEDEKSIAKHLPHATNCSQFCKCDHGKPVTFDCPAGLHFNAILEVCDWPQSAGCVGNPTTIAPSSTSKPTTAVPSSTTAKTTTAAPSTSAETTTAAPVTTASTTTTATNTTVTVSITTAKSTTAAPSTTSEPITDAPSSTKKPTTSAPISSSTAAPSSPTTSKPSDDCPAVGSCPQYEDEKSIAKHLPHATNCSQFCKCNHGKPVTFDCPAGLHFNAILEVCDWPQSAGCAGKPTTIVPSTTSKPTTALPNTSAETTTAAPVTTASTTTTAPSTTSEPVTVSSTTAKTSTAAPSRASEPITDTPSTTAKPTTSTPISSSTEAPSSPTTADTSEDCPAVGICPQYEDEKSIAKHLPHATNCSQFCKCDHGKPVTFDCPAGLHFNAILEVCDWPQNAGCSGKLSTVAPSTTNVPTTAVPSTTAATTTAKTTTAEPSTTAEATTAATASDEPITSAPAKECPAIGNCPQYEDEKSIAKHLPHATNCSQFCKCDHGKPVTFDCPAGLHFNAILEVCDWPQSAGCSAKTTTAAPTTSVKTTTAAAIKTSNLMRQQQLHLPNLGRLHQTK